MVNLVVDLRDEKFGAAALADAQRAIEAAGFENGDSGRDDERLLAWLDDEFGGSWSSEAYAGRSVVARRGDEIAGFATYDARGLRFDWLRGLGAEPGVGIFGPFGVGRAFRKSGIGPQLLTAALARLRERGYAKALIPAVGEEKLIAYYTRYSGAEIAETFSKKRFSNARIRTTILASGSGSNAQAVIDRAREGKLPIEVASVLTNVPGAYVLERARAAGVPASVVAWNRAEQTRAQFDASLLEAVEAQQPELLLLLGWMHVLDERFVQRFSNAINIHPAFLPLDQSRDTVTLPDGSVQSAFRGPRSVRDALRENATWVGATAHQLSVEADRGSILMRKPLYIGGQKEEDAVFAELHPIEHRVVAGAIMRWIFER